MRLAVDDTTTASLQSSFCLYVEGPRDLGLVETWAKTRGRALARWVAEETVILGGNQPQRALDDLMARRREAPGLRALCLLDRDGGESVLEEGAADGFDLFVWSRRHIESYLLVPAAIARCLRKPRRGSRTRRADPGPKGGEPRSVEAFFAERVPPLADEHALRNFDAKALFGAHGELSSYLGQTVPSARVAKAMREAELHTDVHTLLDRLSAATGLEARPLAVRKPKARPS